MSHEDFDRLVNFRDKMDRQRERNPEHPGLPKLQQEYEKRRAALAETEGQTPEEIEAQVMADLYGEGADDAVIGRAFRISLAVLGVLALAAVGLWAVLQREPEPEPEQAIETAPPELRIPTIDTPELPFTDVAAASGVDFVHDNGAAGDKLLPETMGSGAAVFDWNDDGDQDLLLINSTAWPWETSPGALSTPALYDNDGSGRFTDVTARVGLDVPVYGMGVAVADVDADGRRDLYLTAVGENRLLLNRGDRFEDVTAAAGVAGDGDAWSTCAAFVDVDNDGDLDLFVCNYVQWSRQIDFEVNYQLTGIGRAYGPPMNYRGSHNVLYRNDGDGRFTDVSAEAGIQVVNPATGEPMSKALGVSPVDVDQDGWMDLLVANDTVANFYFRNLGEGRFVEEGALVGVAFDRMGNATGAMGVDVGDVRNDGQLAFLVGNFANEMTSLYVTQGDPSLFADEAIPQGIGAPSRTRLTFGLLLADVDLDGRQDLIQTNGHLEEEIGQVDASQDYRQPAQLFWNAGPQAARTFLQVPAEATGDLARPIVGRGSTYGDLDGDGDLDLVMTQVAGPPLVLRNDQGFGHPWLRLRLVDPTGANRDALGARVELTAAGRTQTRWVQPTRSYLSQVELPVTFGLGDTPAEGANDGVGVESVVIHWPDGARQEVDPASLEINTLNVVERQPGR